MINLLPKILNFLTWLFSAENLPQVPEDSPASLTGSGPPAKQDSLFSRESLPRLSSDPPPPSPSSFRELFLTIDSLPHTTSTLSDSQRSFFSWFLSREKLPLSSAGSTSPTTPTRS